MTTLTIVQKIHKEIDTADDRLYNQAMAIIEAGKSFDFDKSERLKKLGFINSSTVIEAEPARLNKLKAEKEALIISNYKTNYPFLKFLTEEELIRICEKYDLVFAHASRYTKDIPEKNLREIELAQELKKEDEFNCILHLIPENKETEQLFIAMGHPNGMFTQQEINDWCIKAHGHNTADWTTDARETTWLYIVNRDLFDGKYRNGYKVEKIKKDGYFIAAPKSHFNLEGLKEDKKGFFEVFKIEPKDPIVFRYVKGGIQVLSKWGDEAEDPALQVPILN